jgi:hypothetical protein
VETYYDRCFPGRWTGSGGSQFWPPRSSELNALIFNCGGHMSSGVPAESGSTWDALFRRILYAATGIKNDHNEVMRATHSIQRRARMCAEPEGAHYEQIL